MILYIFIFLWVLLYFIFTWLAFATKNIKVYITGCLTALFYFLATSEGIIWGFHHKIPVIGFLVNPFHGKYQLFLLNFKLHWPYFVIALIAYIFFYIKLKGTINKPSIAPEKETVSVGS